MIEIQVLTWTALCLMTDAAAYARELMDNNEGMPVGEGAGIILVSETGAGISPGFPRSMKIWEEP